jgi:antibiotic biosynthesis monooxygenase (ABM) superfamily enzyme
MTAKFATTCRASSNANLREMPVAQRRFSRPRFALLVLAGVYPLITLLLYLVLPLLDGWPIWQETVVIAPIMVTIMVWGLIPTVQRVFHGFLNPTAN